MAVIDEFCVVPNGMGVATKNPAKKLWKQQQS
jgi:hypothetical protein